MPLIRDTPKECFDAFREHAAGVLTILTKEPVLLIRKAGDESRASIRLGANGIVPLQALGYGRIHFALAQDVVAIPEQRRVRLRTEHYWYMIMSGDPSSTKEPLFRWEYVADPPPAKDWCRHHFQIGKVANQARSEAVTVPLGESKADLNRLHIPTGPVLFEYVIRFLLSDLGVTPLRPAWREILKDSETKYFREYNFHSRDEAK